MSRTSTAHTAHTATTAGGRPAARTSGSSPWHGANLALAFLLELCALAALGYWGARTGPGPAEQVVLAVAAPLAAAVLWGALASPRARVASRFVRLAVRVVVFGSAVAGLAVTGQHVPALVLAAFVVGNELALGPLRDPVRG